MRVAYVTADPGVPAFGTKGCSVHVREVIDALRRAGAAVTLFASRFDGDRPAGWEDVSCHPLPRAAKGDLPARERASIAANDDLAGLLERHGPFDAVYERYSLFSTAGMRHAARRGIAGILEVNAPLIDEQAAHRGLADRAAAETAAAEVFATATAVVAVSPQVARYVEGFSSAAAGRVHVIPNGVNHRRFRPDVSPALPGLAGRFVVGFAGSMKPWHGLETLLDAFGPVAGHDPRAHLLLVGDGPLRATLEAATAGRADVTFTGAVAGERMPGMLTSMDVAVAPYPPDPGFYFSPLKVYEYMAAGRAVVASRIGSVCDAIEDGVSGLLTDPGDPGALADAIDRLRRDPALRARLGAAAAERVRRSGTWDHVAGRILALARSPRRVAAVEVSA